MASLYYDSLTGDLRRGVVWEANWEVPCDFASPVFGLDLVYAKFVGGRKITKTLCFRGPDHEWDVRFLSADVSLFGKNLGNIVQTIDHGILMVGPDFAKRLNASGLTGFEVGGKVTVTDNFSGAVDPKLELFDFTGSAGFCHRYKIRGAPNVCPHCKEAQVICDYCGKTFWRCPSCGRDVFTEDAAAVDPNLIRFQGRPKELIVANQDWDGSDMFGVSGPGGGIFVSRKAKEWFDRALVVEVQFKEALIDMTPRP